MSARGWKSFFLRCFSPRCVFATRRRDCFLRAFIRLVCDFKKFCRRTAVTKRDSTAQDTMAATELALERDIRARIAMLFFRRQFQSVRRRCFFSLSSSLSPLFFLQLLTAALFSSSSPRERTSRGHATPVATGLCLAGDDLRPTDGSESDGGASRCLSEGR